MNTRHSSENTNNLFFIKTKNLRAVFFFLSVSIFLTNFLLKKAWEPIHKEQIFIQSARETSKELILESLEINFPL